MMPSMLWLLMARCTLANGCIDCEKWMQMLVGADHPSWGQAVEAR